MNRELPLIGRMDGPKAVPRSIVESCRTYRDAVRMAWQLKRVHGMTDYLHKDDKPSRRSLPADKVAEFESVVGNRVVSQWLAAQSQLTVLEEFQAERMAA
jgi:hypothetical protein